MPMLKNKAWFDKLFNWCKSNIFIILIFAGAFFSRLFWMLNIETVQVSDFANYQMIAENVAAGHGHSMHGFAVAWQGSAYPIMLGLFYRIIGSTDEFFGKLLNLFFSMATLVLCWYIFKKIFEKHTLALFALGTAAFLPQYIAYVNVIGTEVFFTFLLASIVFLKLYFLQHRFSFIGCGVLVGVAALTRSFMLVYPVIAAVYHFSIAREIKKSLIFAAAVFAVVFVVVAPWTFRNFRHFGRFIPVSYNGGYVLFVNNNDLNVRGNWIDHHRIVENHPERLAIVSEAHADGRTVHQLPDLEPYFNQWAREWIFQNPGRYLQLGFMRVYRTFFYGANDIPQWAANVRDYNNFTQRRNWSLFENIADTITFVLNGTAVIFMLAALKSFAFILFFTLKKIEPLIAIIFINIAFFVVVTFLFEGQARYAFPVFLFIIPAAVYIFGTTKQALEEWEQYEK